MHHRYLNIITPLCSCVRYRAYKNIITKQMLNKFHPAWSIALPNQPSGAAAALAAQSTLHVTA
jgi:hypothetical protein